MSFLGVICIRSDRAKTNQWPAPKKGYYSVVGERTVWSDTGETTHMLVSPAVFRTD